MYNDNTTYKKAIGSYEGITTTRPPAGIGNSSGNVALDHLCSHRIGKYSKCLACNACTNIACVDSVPGCPQFINDLYCACGQPTEGSDSGKIVFYAGCAAVCSMCVVGGILSMHHA